MDCFWNFDDIENGDLLLTTWSRGFWDGWASPFKEQMTIVMQTWFDSDCVCAWIHVTAGEDAADGSVPIVDLLTPAVLWRYTLHPNEWEKTHLGVSSLWQEGSIWTSHHWWVSAPLLNSPVSLLPLNQEKHQTHLCVLSNNYWTSFMRNLPRCFVCLWIYMHF